MRTFLGERPIVKPPSSWIRFESLASSQAFFLLSDWLEIASFGFPASSAAIAPRY
jgi:hypothetical protein